MNTLFFLLFHILYEDKILQEYPKLQTARTTCINKEELAYYEITKFSLHPENILVYKF